MRRITVLMLGLISLGGLQHKAAATEVAALIEQSCQRCHDNAIYSRPNSIIGSYGELDARVRFCDGAARAGWSEDQQVAVIEYLNNTYYNFKKKF